jgi:hypothetical protein
MAMYTVTTMQLLTATVMSALISAGSVVAYGQYKDLQALPEVNLNVEDKCVKVMNFKNGDAYNCEDVDVVLRQYKKVLLKEPKTKEPPPVINKEN